MQKLPRKLRLVNDGPWAGKTSYDLWYGKEGQIMIFAKEGQDGYSIVDYKEREASIEIRHNVPTIRHSVQYALRYLFQKHLGLPTPGAEPEY